MGATVAVTVGCGSGAEVVDGGADGEGTGDGVRVGAGVGDGAVLGVALVGAGLGAAAAGPAQATDNSIEVGSMAGSATWNAQAVGIPPSDASG
ncbi:hypothetical protein [Micromonospora chersina]|uniref:hypothetical protein n=1 Tax=Micromonospora chersina TaxID=47854 RepID=UPI000B87F792|nr:hypothetical protein [Micromonospora chersina]